MMNIVPIQYGNDMDILLLIRYSEGSDCGFVDGWGSSQPPPPPYRNPSNLAGALISPTNFYSPESYQQLNLAQEQTRSGCGHGCPVCVDGHLARHHHYGGRACYSCRGFFRRAVQTQHYKSFNCPERRSCIIESKSRKSCKWCRFYKCVNLAGMKLDLVMSREERKDRMTHTNKKKSASCVAFGLSHMVTPSSETFPAEERSQFVNLFFRLQHYNHAKCYEFFAKEPLHFQVHTQAQLCHLLRVYEYPNQIFCPNPNPTAVFGCRICRLALLKSCEPSHYRKNWLMHSPKDHLCIS